MLLSLIFSCSMLEFACNSSEGEPLVFPSRFKYQALDFQPTKFYVLTSNSYQEIAAAGNYLAFDDLLDDILDINTIEFEVEQLELLNEQSVRVYFFDYLNITPSDTLLNYGLSDHIVTLFFGSDAVPFLLNVYNNEVRLPLSTIEHSKRLSVSNVDYSATDTYIQVPGNTADLISQRRNQFGLQAGDTIAINNSSYLYPRQ